MECPYDGYIVLMGFGGYTVVSFCVPRRTYMERRPARAYNNVRARALGPTGVYTQITCSVPTVGTNCRNTTPLSYLPSLQPSPNPLPLFPSSVSPQPPFPQPLKNQNSCDSISRQALCDRRSHESVVVIMAGIMYTGTISFEYRHRSFARHSSCNPREM